MFRFLSLWWNVRRLKHDDVGVRCDAAKALGELGDPRAIEALIEAMDWDGHGGRAH